MGRLYEGCKGKLQLKAEGLALHSHANGLPPFSDPKQKMNLPKKTRKQRSVSNGIGNYKMGTGICALTRLRQSPC